MVDYVHRYQPEATERDILSWINYGNAQTYSDRFWTLDPIDGTKGFLRGQQYAIALALIVGGKVVVAALACPNLPAPNQAPTAGLIYTAVRGQGTTCCTLDAASLPQSVQASKTSDSTQARFCESYESGHSAHDQAAAVASHLGITTALNGWIAKPNTPIVARGGADIYLRLPTRPGYVEKIWDHAAGSLVIEEAGGTVTDGIGQPLAFDQGWSLHASRGIIATNGLLHEQVLGALAATRTRGLSKNIFDVKPRTETRGTLAWDLNDLSAHVLRCSKSHSTLG